jgi:protein tyrosine phosphatase
MPLPETTADFWRLVFSRRSQSIVMLNQIEEGDEVRYAHHSRICGMGDAKRPM